MKKLLIASSIFLLAGCVIGLDGYKQAVSNDVKKRAAFDFNCPAENVNVQEVSFGYVNNDKSDTDFVGQYLVSGCGKKQAFNYNNRSGIVAAGAQTNTETNNQ